MKRSPLVSQRSLARMLQAAAECWQNQDYAKYIDILQRANRLAPSNPGVLLDLGRGHGMRYDYAAAERYFEQAIAVARQKGEAMAMAAVHCREWGRHALSASFLERATKQADATGDTFVKLAEIYERLRRLDDASNAVERALHLDRNNALALLVQARLARLAGRLSDAETIVRSFLGRNDAATWSTRIRGWYELGAILDRQGRYDEAMAAFLEAKAMIQPHAGPYLASQGIVQSRLKEVEVGLSAEMLQRWFDAGRALQPPHRLALLCGHPRSGTTLLEQVLDAHPDAISAEETVIFNHEAYLPLRRGHPRQAPMVSVLESASAPALQKARQVYFRCMESFLGQSIGGRILIDKNPSLTSLIAPFARIFPEAKFLVALRDPRDVCLSCFMQPLPLNDVSAMFLSLDRTVSEYASVMGLWKAMAPQMPNACLQVRYEDVVDDLESVARRVLEFLGLPWDASVLHFDEHARNKLVRSPTYADVAKPISKAAVGRWKNYQKYLEPHLEKLEPFVKAYGYE